MDAVHKRNLRRSVAIGAAGLLAAGGVALWAIRERPQPLPATPKATAALAPSVARVGAPANGGAPPGSPSPNGGAWVDVNPRVQDRAAPFVIGLHGRGDRAEHFAALAQRLAPHMPWRLLQGPLPFRDGYQWFRMDAADGGMADLQRAADLVRGHIASAGSRDLHNGTQQRKVALVGFSQGCMLSAWFATRYPDAVQAVLCISGALPRPPDPAPAARRPKLLFVYGGEDPIVAPAAVQETVCKLEELGFPTEQIEHGEGHVVPEGELGRMRAWLEKAAQEAPTIP
jgi:phospholipase/carboxylesterase